MKGSSDKASRGELYIQKHDWRNEQANEWMSERGPDAAVVAARLWQITRKKNQRNKRILLKQKQSSSNTRFLLFIQKSAEKKQGWRIALTEYKKGRESSSWEKKFADTAAGRPSSSSTPQQQQHHHQPSKWLIIFSSSFLKKKPRFSPL